MTVMVVRPVCELLLCVKRASFPEPRRPGLAQHPATVGAMARTIKPEDEAARPRCPKCGAEMELRSVDSDLRESSKGEGALICPSCRYRAS